MKKLKCPECNSQKIVKNGRDYRLSDSKYVQRLLCKDCGKRFSNATFSPNKNQNKRRLNNDIYLLFVHGMSISNIASYLQTTKTTVLRKLKFISKQKKKKNLKLLESKRGQVELIQFDELMTHEHTKCKPLSVVMIVEKGTGFILGFRVSKSPATGRLAKISRQKYGHRPNQEKKGLRGVFDDIIPYLSNNVLVESDKKVIYRPIVKQKLTASKIKFTHIQYKGEKNKERAQGEMINHAKKYDPLFWINHTFAKLRYKVSRLIRKTWCNTKKQENLEDHLHIMMYYNNQLLLKKNKPSNQKTHLT